MKDGGGSDRGFSLNRYYHGILIIKPRKTTKNVSEAGDTSDSD
jgi:hypothetical protein